MIIITNKQSYKDSKTILECECGCTYLSFSKCEWKKESENEESFTDYYLQFQETIINNPSIIWTIIKRLKRCWNILIGKSIIYSEVTFDSKEIKLLIEFLDDCQRLVKGEKGEKE